jgi:hypothetical protein
MDADLKAHGDIEHFSVKEGGKQKPLSLETRSAHFGKFNGKGGPRFALHPFQFSSLKNSS